LIIVNHIHDSRKKTFFLIKKFNIMSNLFTCFLLTSLLLFSSLSVYGQNCDINSSNSVIQNGNFESGSINPNPYIGLAPGSTVINPWVISGAGIDYIGSFWASSEGARSIDLNEFGSGAIAQSFITTIGEWYHVSFDLAGNPDGGPNIKTLMVSVGNYSELFNFDITGFTRSNMGWTTKNFSFQATGTTSTVSFISNVGGGFGPAIDNVTIVEFDPFVNPVCQNAMLQALEEDCNNTVNTLHNDYACQYFCIADKTCQNYAENGANGWSCGFVNYIWDFFASRNDGPLYQSNDCNGSIFLPEDLDEYMCFAKEGFLDHYFTEMAPAFFSYCNNRPIESQNVDSWDENHDAFLENAVVPCFTEFIDMPELLNCATARNTEFLARLLRDVSQEHCNNSSDANSGIADILTSFTNDFIGGDGCCFASGATDLASGFDFYSVCSNFDIIEVGDNLTGTFIDLFNPFDGANRMNYSDTLYFIDLDPQYYEIQNGQLSIIQSPSPFAQISPIVNVFSYIEQDSIIRLEQQFIISDIDSDGDLLGDNFESSIGLDPNLSNFGSLDIDNDGIDDFVEAVIGSNPLDEDSDGDGFSDGIEFNTNTDYNNPLNYTSANIFVKDSLGNEYIEIHDFSQNQNQYILLGDFSNLDVKILDYNDNVIEVLDNQQSSIVIRLSNYVESELKLNIQHLNHANLYFEAIIAKN